MTSRRDRAPEPQKYLPTRKRGQPKPKLAYTHVYENGERRMIRLGRWGSPESYREYRRVAALDLAGKPVDLARRATRRSPAALDGSPTVAELCAQFLLWSEKHHRDKGGNPTGSTDNYRHALVPLLRGIFVRAVLSFYRRRARNAGQPGGRTGAVVCTQRFDSALRVDVHFHALVLDGVYTGFGPGEDPVFQLAEPLRDEEVEALVRHVRALITGRLRHLGHLDESEALDAGAGEELDQLGICQAAAIQGRIPFGPAAGTPTGSCATAPPPGAGVRKKLCASERGFSLHAAVRVGAGQRERLERLCRYVTRPPLAQDRLSVTGDGKIVYRFRRPWRNGTSAVVMDPMTFLSRLAAQIPPPRFHMLSYYGVLAPAAGKRDRIVPGYEEAENDGSRVRAHSCPRESLAAASAHRPRRQARLYYPWAELLRRTFLVDVLACACGARRRVLSLVQDPDQIRRCLSHLGLPTEAPARAPPRAVQGVMGF